MALKDVLLDELRDMYSAENQLVKALPKLAKGAENPKLKQLFSSHLDETKGQVERLKKVFAELDEKPTGHQNLSGKSRAATRNTARSTATMPPTRLTALTSVRPPAPARSGQRTAPP